MQLLKPAISHTPEANKDSKTQVCSDTMDQGRVAWEKIDNAWQNALELGIKKGQPNVDCLYLENVIECLAICKLSGCDAVEMLEVSPSGEHGHSVNHFTDVRRLSELNVRRIITVV